METLLVRIKQLNGLFMLRVLFNALLSAPVLIAIITAVITDGLGPVEGWVVPVSAICAGLSLLSPQLVRRRRIRADSESEFARWYRSTFFLGFALAEWPFIVTFAIALSQGASLPVFIGVAGYVIGMAFLAPSERNLTSMQERLRGAGSPVDVRQALMENLPT